jgi:hypothetical protein
MARNSCRNVFRFSGSDNGAPTLVVLACHVAAAATIERCLR